jgi:hypothetical protein
MPPTVTPIYAALLALVFLVLSVRVILYRRERGVSLGDRDDLVLRTRIRAQANCVEYVPLGLLLLLMAEMQGLPRPVLHGLGFALLAGRVLHALAFGDGRMSIPLRVSGMGLTLTAIGVSAFCLLLLALP